MTDLIERHQPAVWIYGHNHYSMDQRRGKNRLVSNQLGYPHETDELPAYMPCIVLQLHGL